MISKSPKITYLLLVWSFISFSQNQLYTAYSIPIELREDANAVVRNSSTSINIESVNELVYSKKYVVTVLNKLGDSDARISESYDEDTKITNLSAIIYDAFGNEIKKYKERDFTDVSAVDGGSLYSDSKVKYVRHTPISYPYTLVFETEYRTSTTGFIPWWVPVNGYYLSVENSSYTIKNPTQIPWRVKEANFDNFEIDKNKTETEIRFSLQNQKALDYERNSISSLKILPIAKVALDKFYLKGVFGEATNWQEFGKWMYNSLIDGRDFINETTKSKILALTKNATSPLEKAKIVYQYMQDKTRYISVQVGIGGWEPIAANKVDEVGYGDCKGLTNYTKALLDVVGVKSYYTLVYAKDKRDIDKDFSSLQGNHAILNIPIDGKDIWLECTNQTIPFGFLGDFTNDRNVLVITPEGGIIKKTAVYKNHNNLQTISGQIDLQENGTIKADIIRTSQGLQYDDKSYYDNLTENELKKHYKTRVWNYNNNLQIDKAELENNKEKVEFVEALKITINDFATINNNDYIFRVNILNRESFVPKRYRNRKMPLEIDRGYKDLDSITFKLPSNFTLNYEPANIEVNSKFGSYKITFKVIDKNTFTYIKEIEIREGVYPKEDYKAYRAFRKKIAKSENLRIILTKKQ